METVEVPGWAASLSTGEMTSRNFEGRPNLHVPPLILGGFVGVYACSYGCVDGSDSGTAPFWPIFKSLVPAG